MLRQILFVDDDPNVLSSMKRALHSEQDKWQTSYFSSALEALQSMNNPSPKVIVTDWNMPGMDGLDLCHQIRKLEEEGELNNNYIIFLTGKQGVEKTVEALEKGADDFITKPCDARELIARIQVGFRIIELQNDLKRANQQLEVFARSMSA